MVLDSLISKRKGKRPDSLSAKQLLSTVRAAVLCAVWISPGQLAVAQTIKSAQTVSFNMRGQSAPALKAPETEMAQPQPEVTAFFAVTPVTVEPAVESPVESTSIAAVNGHTVACQAATCWPLAKLLEERARTLLCDAQDRHKSSQTSASLQANFLRHQAVWQRDIAAGTALKAYYTWIANQQQLKLVEEGLLFQNEQVRVQEALIAKGIAIADPTELDRKRLELEDNKVQLLSAQRQLTSGLLRLTCCHTDLSQCATESLEIQPQAADCGALVTYALQHRHDYLAIVQLCQCLDEETAVSIAQLLTPLIGVGIDVLDMNLVERLCLKARGEELLAQVRRELKLASDVWRTRIEQSVCDKCQALDAAYQRVQIAEQVVSSWETRLAALKRLEELGDARGEAMATARAQWISARSTLVTRQLSAKLAEVELAEAVGELSVRCCQGQPWLVR